jgi:hypothetical protein
VKQLLNDYLEQGLIAPVEEATDWAAPLVVFRRSNEKLRIVVDHTRLNRFVRRSTHPLERLGMRSQKSTAKQIFSRVSRPMWLLAGLYGEIARESARGKKREERKE